MRYLGKEKYLFFGQNITEFTYIIDFLDYSKFSTELERLLILQTY
jgi:hypothetical protein